jgi:hypothetical protein
MGKLTQTKLDTLRVTVEHCSPQEGLTADYLQHFADWSPENKCLCCGKTATFTWGLVHGEGHCYDCGWPARLYHFVKDAEGKETRVVRLLQYHPDEISLSKESDADVAA